VDCSALWLRWKTPFSWESITGAVATGTEARAWMLCARTLNATSSAES